VGGRSLAFYTGVLGFRRFEGGPGTLAAAGKAGPRSAVIGFTEEGTKVCALCGGAGGAWQES
jgi:hypothetical protein